MLPSRRSKRSDHQQVALGPIVAAALFGRSCLRATMLSKGVSMNSQSSPVAHNLHYYLPARSKAYVATGLLLLLGIVTVISIISTMMETNLIRYAQAGATVTLEEANSNDRRQMLVSFLYLGAVVPAAAGFLFWIHKISRNIRYFRLSNEQMPRFSVGWAISCVNGGGIVDHCGCRSLA